MCSTSTSISFELAVRRCDATGRGADSESVGPVATIISRSITLRSSRTLPGQL